MGREAGQHPSGFCRGEDRQGHRQRTHTRSTADFRKRQDEGRRPPRPLYIAVPRCEARKLDEILIKTRLIGARHVVRLHVPEICLEKFPMPHEKIVPLPHQAEGTEFLRQNDRAALFDEQGLGKTKQLIDAIAAEIQRKSLSGAVIICPNGLKTTWAEEIKKISELPIAVFGAGRKARRSSFTKSRAAFYVINYEAVGAELPALKACSVSSRWR